MNRRTDLAAPTVIDPAAFTFVAGVYFGSNPGEDFDAVLGEWMGDKDPDGKAGWYSKRPQVLENFPPLVPNSNFVRKGTCDHCGARFDWGSVYQHTSGAHIVVGNVCANKTMDVSSRAELDVKRLKSALEAQRKAFKNTILACEQAIAHGFVWLYAEEHTNPTLADIKRKGLAWAGLSDRQIELINNIRYGRKAQWQVDREAAEAARVAELAATEPVPVTTERIDVEGEIISTKTQDGFMPGSYVTKMLVKTTQGFKLWGAVPTAISNTLALKGEYDLRGRRVKFSAKVERSKNDDKFGFFSRPTKAQVVQA